MMTSYDNVIMRTIIDLPVDQVEALDTICRREQISRAEAIRRAVSMLIREAADPGDAFGLWRERAEDGLAYQQRLRREWSDTFNSRGRKDRQ